MGLDLKSLKKIGPASQEADVATSTTPNEDAVATMDPIASSTISAPASSSPKLSLSALKKESGTAKESATQTITPTPSVEANLPQQEESNWKPDTVIEAPITVESIIQEEPAAMSIEVDDDPKEVLLGLDAIEQEVSKESTTDTKEETLSLGFDKKQEIVTEASLEPQKVFFPEFDVTKEFGLDDDLFSGTEANSITTPQAKSVIEEPAPEVTEADIQEVISATSEPHVTEEPEIIKEPEMKQEESINTESSISIQEAPLITEPREEMSILEESVEVEIPSIQEALAEATTEEAITPEYVEGVKKTLSEPEIRKGGISRLAKTLVAAAITGILVIGGMVGWGALSKYGKANITESTNTAPTTSAATNPPVETPTNTETPVLTGTSQTNTGETIESSGATESGTTTNTGTTNTGTTSTGSITETGATSTGTTSTGGITESGTTNTGNVSTGAVTTTPIKIETPAQTPEITPPTITQTMTSTSGVEYQTITNTKKNIPRAKRTPPQQ